jgi:hypothetical protein
VSGTRLLSGGLVFAPQLDYLHAAARQWPNDTLWV